MPSLLEELQSRVTDAKNRLDAATRIFQSAQQGYQVAQQDYNVWNAAFLAEQRDEQRKVAIAAEKQMVMLPQPNQANSEHDEYVDVVDIAEELAETSNKTDKVRDLLRRHPGGMTAVDIWDEVRSEFKHRPYLYSVLKRLRDKEEIIKRRGKYCLKLTPKPSEDQEHSAVQ